jgi:molybdate transport system regulatory protein
MGEGRREILENIEKTGSINQTAKIMGSHLTKEGKILLKKYALLKGRCLKAEDKIFNAIFSK